jgi:transcriptional regulator with XRE-family HTH domain
VSPGGLPLAGAHKVCSGSRMHRTFIGSVERGERNVSIPNLKVIAEVLRVPLAELLTEVKHDK